jgi:catechol-2,3-dioxygenase
MKRSPSSMAVGHVGQNVSDVDLSTVFYLEVFGFTIVHESIDGPFRFVSMAQGGKVVLTLWQQHGGRFKKRRPGLHHLAFEAASIERR